MNLNKNYEKDYKLACALAEQEFTHSDLIKMLNDGEIPEKQFAALNLDCVNDKAEGEALVNNLTGCDGKIREAVSLKINKLISKNPSVTEYFIYPEIFAYASIDINANICRMVIDSVTILKQNKTFSNIYLKKILEFIDEAFNEIDKFIYKDKKYVINKQLFKLYWCLESLKLFVNDISVENLLKILERASLETEYTIREKVAQILVLTDNENFSVLAEKLKNDDNYYVRTAINKK